MYDARDLPPTQALNQPSLPTPRPVSRRVHVDHIRAGRRGTASSFELASCPPIGPPFCPESTRGMGGEQFGFPAFGREFSEGVHDGRHTPWCIARADVHTLRMGLPDLSASEMVANLHARDGRLSEEDIRAMGVACLAWSSFRHSLRAPP